MILLLVFYKTKVNLGQLSNVQFTVETITITKNHTYCHQLVPFLSPSFKCNFFAYLVSTVTSRLKNLSEQSLISLEKKTMAGNTLNTQWDTLKQSKNRGSSSDDEDNIITKEAVIGSLIPDVSD